MNVSDTDSVSAYDDILVTSDNLKITNNTSQGDTASSQLKINLEWENF